ncbi:MAG: hypothetical protein DVS81_00750 [Candidatus Accumulibacter meliphilus]|uniref:Uncharacterized protein n=1 Tax=Candidatus Accumulibacter meliphilus TaxID=2211374 RepID=A0A369XU88_9PROT|nr:MAG: hypothetical protein DVS81_00750 [Candidatus Accumulibacter meliphilus]
MSRFRARRLLLGCSASDLVLLAEPEATTDAPQLLAALAVAAPAAATASAVTAALGAALAGLQPAPLAAADQAPAGAQSAVQSHFLSVTLDDGLVRSFVVTPPRGAQGLRELRATAAARFAGLYGESAEHWLLVGDWHASSPFIVCALPRALYRALDQWAQAHSWRLDSMAPALVRVCNRLCASIPSDGWLLVGFGQTLSLLNLCNDQIASTRSLPLPGVPDFAALETLLAQERLRSPDQGASGRQQSLLWAGAADWLPLASHMAGLESRTIRLPDAGAPAGAGSSAATQLALAGRCS